MILTGANDFKSDETASLDSKLKNLSSFELGNMSLKLRETGQFLGYVAESPLEGRCRKFLFVHKVTGRSFRFIPLPQLFRTCSGRYLPGLYRSDAIAVSRMPSVALDMRFQERCVHPIIARQLHLPSDILQMPLLEIKVLSFFENGQNVTSLVAFYHAPCIQYH